LSIIIQYLNNTEIAFEVPRTSFIPAPKVNSAIVSLSSRENIDNPVFDFDKFCGFVRGCFLHRRKTFWNNLQGLFGKTPEIKNELKLALQNFDIDAGIRPEKLSIDEYVELANYFHDKKML
jgi:16S rRNA (adenine1518-N6/adenine1519-N6)-dimethyltransferase